MSGTNFVDTILEVKRATPWDLYAHVADPLDHPDMSPHEAIPNHERSFTRFGRHLGAIGGGIAGIALPALAGFAAGSAGGYGLEHLINGHAELGSSLQHTLGTMGAVAALPVAAATAPVGAGIGALLGEQTGGAAGRTVEHLYSPERQAAERIKRMPTNHGYATIRTLERTGRTSPDELQAMKDTYNTRRESLRDQARAWVI